MHINPLHPPIPKDRDNLVTWDNLSDAAISLSIANLSRAQSRVQGKSAGDGAG